MLVLKIGVCQILVGIIATMVARTVFTFNRPWWLCNMYHAALEHIVVIS